MEVEEVMEFRGLFEMMLCHHQWMRKETMSKHQVAKEAEWKLHVLFRHLKKVVDWSVGNGLKTPKTHQILHVGFYIL